MSTSRPESLEALRDVLHKYMTVPTNVAYAAKFTAAHVDGKTLQKHGDLLFALRAFQKNVSFCQLSMESVLSVIATSNITVWRFSQEDIGGWWPLWLKPFSLELSLFVDTGLGVWFVVVCVAVAIPATVFLLCWCGPCPKDFRSGMGSDGFQAQRRGSWIPGKEMAEEMLADAISIDGRIEWICIFCSESNVWTRWRCRRCHTNIAAGLWEKYRQVVAARTGE